LAKLAPADVRAMHTTVMKSAGGRSAQKADRVLRLALKAAVREGVLAHAVTDRIDPPVHRAEEGTAFASAVAAHIIATAVEIKGVMSGAAGRPDF
jgi:hypothetical protein